MGKNGGARPGAGRKSKAEELGLDDLMDSIGPTESVLKRIYELAVGIEENKEKGVSAKAPNIEAQKLWMSYKFGKPKENVTVKQDTTIQWIEEDGNTSS
jgi:hypothetical protein